MKKKWILLIAGVVTFVGGIGVVLIPDQFLDPFGMTLNDAGVHMARLNEATALVLGALFWFARNWMAWDHIRVVAITGLISYGVALIVALISTTSGLMNSFGWVNVALDAIFTFGFGYILFIRKTAYNRMHWNWHSVRLIKLLRVFAVAIKPPGWVKTG